MSLLFALSCCLSGYVKSLLFSLSCSLSESLCLHTARARGWRPCRDAMRIQCTAVCCSALQCVAVRCSALQWLQCVAVCCSVLSHGDGGHVAMRCISSVLQCVAVRFSALQWLQVLAVSCSVLQCAVTRCVSKVHLDHRHCLSIRLDNAAKTTLDKHSCDSARFDQFFWTKRDRFFLTCLCQNKNSFSI